MEPDPVHPILEDEDEDEDEEPPRILLYHGESHGQARALRCVPAPRWPGATARTATWPGARGTTGGQDSGGLPRHRHVVWRPPGPWGPRLHVS